MKTLIDIMNMADEGGICVMEEFQIAAKEWIDDLISDGGCKCQEYSQTCPFCHNKATVQWIKHFFNLN